MPLTLDDADSPLLQDAQTSFVGGQLSNAVPLQLSEDQYSLAEDCDTSISGQAESRRGTAQLGPAVGVGAFVRGLSFYQLPTNQAPVAITDTILQNYNGTIWAPIGAINFLNVGMPAVIIEGNSLLYVVDGLGAIYKWNGTVWTALVTDTPPTNVKFLIWHTNRLVAANATIGGVASPDGVFFSGLQNDNLWATQTGGYQLQPGAGDGRPITAIAAWSNFNIAVFKENSTWLITADPILDVSAMPVSMIHGRIGCVAPLSVSQVGADIFFLSSDGVRSLQQTLASDSRYELGTPLSFPVQDVIKRINPTNLNKSCSIFWKGRYLLAVPLDSSATNNYILVYNSVTGKWSGGWTNLPVSCFGVRNDAGVEKLMMGLANSNKVIEYLDFVQEANATDATYADYNGAFIAPKVISRGMIFNDLYSPKKPFLANIILNKSKGPMSITANFDEGALRVTKTIDTGDPAGFPIPFPLPFTFPRKGIQPCSMDLMPYPKFHQVQFELMGTGPGRKEIRQITVQAFPEASDLRGKFEATSAIQVQDD